MELVYLWVEDYKNIKKQGFNFSPQFECKFHDKYEKYIDRNGKEKERLIDNCKLEIKPKEHIENFFGDNINITAIVGKNGSGKSSILELLYWKFSFYPNNSLLIFRKDKQFFLISKLKIKYSSKLFITIVKKKEELNNCIFPLFDYSFQKSTYYKDKDFPVFPSKYRDGKFNFYKEESNNIKTILTNYLTISQSNKLNIFNSYFEPAHIVVFQTKYFNRLENISDKNRGNVVKKLNKESYLSFQKRDSKKGLKFLKDICSIKIFNEVKTEKEYLESIGEPKYELKDSLYSKNLHHYKDFSKPYNENNIPIFIGAHESLLKDNFETDKIIFAWDINSIDKDKVESIINNFSEPKYRVEIVDKKGKMFNSLSYGEKQLLIILNNLLDLILNSTKEHYVCFLDEIDIGFHPEWQKKVLKYIIEFLSFIPEKKFHLIFTSHSPFLLSDVPKENILFLNNKLSIKQTFGANIHTLLSDSFFMEDGLMGEFAKSKIDRAIKLLNQEQLNEDELKYCEQIISIIGEPIVKNQLQRMLDSKRLKKVDEIDAIKKSMIAMKQRLDELEK